LVNKTVSLGSYEKEHEVVGHPRSRNQVEVFLDIEHVELVIIVVEPRGAFNSVSIKEAEQATDARQKSMDDAVNVACVEILLFDC
jgi:hypothetical protein